MPPSPYLGPIIFFLFFLFIETRAHVVQAGFLSQTTTSAEITGISQLSKLLLIYLIFKLALLICMYVLEKIQRTVHMIFFSVNAHVYYACSLVLY